MRLLILSILTTITFKSCTTIDIQDSFGNSDFSTDIEFAPYIQEFESYAKINTSAVPIGFDDLDESVVGVCYYSKMNNIIEMAYIKIDRDYWNKASQYKRINLIFHELGHCVLGRDHVEWKTPNECPPSFMHNSIVSNYCLKKYYKNYLKEMFPNWEGR